MPVRSSMARPTLMYVFISVHIVIVMPNLSVNWMRMTQQKIVGCASKHNGQQQKQVIKSVGAVNDKVCCYYSFFFVCNRRKSMYLNRLLNGKVLLNNKNTTNK